MYINALGVTSEKNRQFKDILQIGQIKFIPEIQNDFYFRHFLCELLSMKMKSTESLKIKE